MEAGKFPVAQVMLMALAQEALVVIKRYLTVLVVLLTLSAVTLTVLLVLMTEVLLEVSKLHLAPAQPLVAQVA